jgi:hypothetical protein
MNFDEKDSMLFDDKEKKSTGLTFIIVALLLCIIAGLVVVAFKYNGMDFNFTMSSTSSCYMFIPTLGDAMIRLVGMVFLVVSVRAGCRKMFLYDNNMKWYKIIVGVMIGSTFLVYGFDIIMFYAKLLADVYH